MNGSSIIHRFVFARLVGSAMLLCVSLGAGNLSAQQTMEKPSAEEPGQVSVFGPAAAERRSTLTHPELRTELLRMAAEDQAARSAAT